MAETKAEDKRIQCLILAFWLQNLCVRGKNQIKLGKILPVDLLVVFAIIKI